MKIGMNSKVALRQCDEYDPQILELITEEIYDSCGGAPIKDMKVLVKPNILSDSEPSKCISTHPALVEAVIKFLQCRGASEIYVGDSPAIHKPGFSGKQSGIRDVCDRTGAQWINFNHKPATIISGGRKIKIASAALEVDLIISLPKLKTHELMYFTGAIKNTMGLMPGFLKAKQHGIFQNRVSFAKFLIDMNEAITPHFFLIDGIMSMEGPGPANGIPVKTGIIAGSVNPVALDIIVSGVAGYQQADIPTTAIALERGLWLKSEKEIVYDGPPLSSVKKSDFRRVTITPNRNIAIQFVLNRIKPLRKLEKRPVFLPARCISCGKCVEICPVDALVINEKRKNHIKLTDGKCIRCFCCSEVCPVAAIEIRRKLFGQ